MSNIFGVDPNNVSVRAKARDHAKSRETEKKWPSGGGGGGLTVTITPLLPYPSKTGAKLKSSSVRNE